MLIVYKNLDGKDEGVKKKKSLKYLRKAAYLASLIEKQDILLLAKSQDLCNAFDLIIAKWLGWVWLNQIYLFYLYIFFFFKFPDLFKKKRLIIPPFQKKIFYSLTLFEMKVFSSSSSSYRAGSTDIPDPLPPLLPIVHRPR